MPRSIVPAGPEYDPDEDPAPVLTPLEVTNYSELPQVVPDYVKKIALDLDARPAGVKPAYAFDKAAQVRYLMYLSKFGLKSSAAQYAGVSQEAVRLKKVADQEFANAIDDCMEIFRDNLEQIALKRAVDGWDEPVYQKGELAGTIHRHSERMMEMLLKRHIVEFRENIKVDNSVNGGVLLIPQALSADEWESTYGPNSPHQNPDLPLQIEGTVEKEKDPS